MLKRYNDRILRRLLENGMLLNRILNFIFIFLKFLNNEEEEIQIYFEENKVVVL